MKKIFSILFCISFCLAVAFFFPNVGSSNLYVDENSECLTCHTIEAPGAGSEGEQHYDHANVSCDSCHEGTPARGNVPAKKCTQCHKEKCDSVNSHESEHGATCLNCHADCAVGDDDDDTGDDDDDDSDTDECVVKGVYGVDSEEAELLRDLRDNVLSKTPAGVKIITLYYKWSPVLTEAIKENENLRVVIKTSLDNLLILLK